MKPTNCTRHTFDLGAYTLPYARLRNYVCNECGGGIVHRAMWDTEADTSVDSVACAACGCGEMISERRYLEQISEGWEVLNGLPEPLRAKMKGDRQCLSATEAIDDLFDSA